MPSRALRDRLLGWCLFFAGIPLARRVLMIPRGDLEELRACAGIAVQFGAGGCQPERDLECPSRV
ncbi:MAG: hypothetical protein KC492_33050, partial [Myxococcales bacterium]|nr:hypothetical protein [Myxococcales bacterium]